MDLSKLNRRTFLQASAAAGLAAAVERISRAFPIHVAHMGGVKRG